MRKSTQNPFRLLLMALLILLGSNAIAQNVTVNPGGGSYPTLAAAFAAINAGTHTGAVTVDIINSTSETGPCVLNASGAGSASYTSVVIRPASGGITVSGATVSGRGLIELNGADNVTIDGDAPGGGINRDLTIQNTAANTITFTSCIRLATSTLITNCDNVTIKNCNIIGSGTNRNDPSFTAEVTTWGIIAGGGASTVSTTTAPSALTSATTTSAGGQTHSNLLIDNNNIQSVARGISLNGSAGTVFPNALISNNLIGNATQGALDQVTAVGITINGTTNGIVRGNTVYVEGYIASSTPNRAINVGMVSTTGLTNVTIEKNIVGRMINNNPGTWTAVGIDISGGTNHIIQNNFVGDCLSSQVSGTGAFSTLFGSFGIRINAGTGHKIYHNTVHFSGTVPGTTSTLLVANLCIVSSSSTGMDIRNNIFSNKATGGNPTPYNTVFACVYFPSGLTSSFNLTWNNNAYYSGTGTQWGIAQRSTTGSAANLFKAADFNPAATSPSTNWRSYTSTLSVAGTNDNASFANENATPVVSGSNLHIDLSSAFAIQVDNTGVNVGVLDDIDGDSRTGPDIGADEFALAGCAGQPTGGTASASANPVCQNNQTTLSLSGHSTGAGITYQWQKSATPGGPYTDITGATTATYVYTPSSAGTEYIVCKVTCTNSGLDELSSEITLTVNPSPSSTNSGPSTGLTYQNLSYTVTGYPLGSTFQWQFSTTSCATGFSNITGATTDNLVAVASASGTYYIRCMVTNAGCSAPSNCIVLTVTVAGDNVCDAITVTTGNNGPFSNQTATAQPNEVVPPGTGCTTQTGWCSSTGTINSVWFKFTPAVSGRYSIHLVYDPPTMNYFDSQLAIYSVGDCNNFGTFTLIAANDDSVLASPFNSYIAPVCLTAGTTYYILADGYGSTVSNAFGIRIVQVSTLTASISGTDNICLGNSGVVTLNFTGTPPFSYTIAGNGGPYTGSTSNTTQNVAVLPVSGGTQTYTVTSFGDGQCPNGGAGTGSATVNVSTAPPAGTIHTVNAPVSACAGSVQLITANHGVTGSFINFSWNTGTNSSAVLFSNNIGGPFVAGPFVTNGPNVYAQFGALGGSQSGYNICVQAVNGCGSSNNKCNFTRGTVSVPAGITGSSIQCSGASGQTYSVTGPAPAGVETYVWSFSVPGATITSLDPPLNSQVSIDFPAFTTGTLSVQAALSCLGSSVSPARTLAISTATAAPGVPSGPSKVCPGSSYNYSVAPVAGATTYNWTVPANASITAGAGTNSITVQFNATPINFVNGIISVNTTSVCGATSGTTSRTVSSMVPSTPGIISGQATGVCNGTYNYQVPAVPGVIYNWTLPAGATGSSTTNIIPVTFSNSYVSGTISVTGSAAGCPVQSLPRNLNVSGVPATPAAITSPFPPCNGGPGQFSTGTVFGATGYTWTVPANGTTLDLGQGTTTIDVTWGTGNGTVTVKADNACGSSGLRTLYYVPGCRLAAEEASEVNSLTVYPNPAQTQATIAFKATVQGSYTITLTDVSGRIVRSMVTDAQAGAHQVIIDLSDIAKGMYMVELRSDTGTEIQKLVVE